MMRKIVKTNLAPSAIGPYEQGIWVENTLYISGQIALCANGESKIGLGIAAETQQVMQNLKVILESQNLSFSNLVKCSIFLKNMEYFAEVNEIYASFFSNEIYPARETVEVSALPKNALVEISAVGYK